jgi:MoxR-like ATPase
MDYTKILQIETQLRSFFVERDDVIRGLSLAVLSDSNVLMIGPPGTAKSMIAYSWSKHIVNYKFFAALLTKFSTPEELAGPFSIKSLNDDRYVRQTSGMLPEAHIAFLDETFNGNSGVLNFLLTLMNERIFYNDGKANKAPLLTLIGASNQIPEPEDALEAMYDRFLLKFIIDPITEEVNFLKMILSEDFYKPEIFISLEEINESRQNIKDVNMADTIGRIIADLRKSLHHDGILVTDRTFKKSVQVIKAEAYLNGRTNVIEDDIDVLKHVLWIDPDDRKKAYTNILTIINPDKNKVIEIYDKCSIEFEKFKKETNDKKKVDLGAELVFELKNSKVKIHEYYNKATDTNKNELLSYEKQVHKYLDEVHEELGINF